MAEDQAELILYYKQTYPFLKFLTEDELDRICEKYGLIHATVDRYVKEVPEKNILDIEQAQELKEDDRVDRDWVRAERMEQQMLRRSIESDILSYYMGASMFRDSFISNRIGLFIAAPKSHFNLRGLVKTSLFGWGKPEVKDPIVFRYVRGGIQVLTKWGVEGEDPMLYNEKLN